MDYSARITELAEKATSYIKIGGAPRGHVEIAMRKLANDLLEDCAALVHDRLGADGYGVAKMIRARKVGD